MTLKRLGPVLDPDDWGKVVAAAKKAEAKNDFPTPILKFDKIGTRWSEDHRVIIGMRSATEKATTGFVKLNNTYVDRVFEVPWPDQAD